MKRTKPPTPRFGFVSSGPGFHVWEETRAEALHTARELSRGAPVQATPVARRPRRGLRARPR
jgi:hypothetical protein